MFDWKILAGLPAVSAVVGYVAGLLSDPLKKEIGDWRRRRLLRKSLYGELARNYSGLVMFLAPEKLKLLEHRFLENIKEWAGTPAYDYARSQQELFFGLKEWSAIVQINESLKKLLEGKFDALPDIGMMGVSFAGTQGKNLISMIEEAALGGTLSIRLFSGVIPDISNRLREIKSGKRKKSSETYAEIERRFLDEVL
jgi:hypothetical protein